MNKPTPFLAWIAKTQPISLTFIHLVLPACAWSLATDRPETPWDIIGWVSVAIPAIGYWVGNYWYWRTHINPPKQ